MSWGVLSTLAFLLVITCPRIPLLRCCRHRHATGLLSLIRTICDSFVKMSAVVRVFPRHRDGSLAATHQKCGTEPVNGTDALCCFSSVFRYLRVLSTKAKGPFSFLIVVSRRAAVLWWRRLDVDIPRWRLREFICPNAVDAARSLAGGTWPLNQHMTPISDTCGVAVDEHACIKDSSIKATCDTMLTGVRDIPQIAAN